MSSSRGLLLVNPRSGDDSPSADGLGEAARELGLDVRVLARGDDAAELAGAAAARGATIGIAGGDGSLGSVAGAAVDAGVPFVCIPFGTRNHFARDLGLDPGDPLSALAAFGGEERAVDIGKVGERWFVNNVSLGLYASFVHDPQKKTRNRLRALLRMLPAALGRSRAPLDLALEVEGRREHHSALVVLVANNGYTMTSMADLGSRTRLDEGALHAYVIEAVSRRALLGLLARAAFGSPERAQGWSEWGAEHFVLDGHRAHVHAAIDGEAAILPSPLEFEVRPRALRVLVPPQES